MVGQRELEWWTRDL